MPFLIVRNDIAKVYADVIVNPANEDLLEGSGTSKAIYMAAGEEQLKKACFDIGHCELGKAVITDAFNLMAKYIIHAVGPIWNGGCNYESEKLYSAYTESLKLAEKYGCESIAFPLLSTGNYGYPKDKAMKVAISAISDFLMNHEMIIYMVLYDRDSFSISKKLFMSIEEYIDDNYVEENDEILKGDELYPYYIRQNIEVRREIKGIQRGDEYNDLSVDLGDELWIEKENERIKFRRSVMSVPKRTLESLVDNMDETFSEMLLRLIDERGLKDSVVYKKANVDRRHFSKIRNDIDYSPTKKTVIAFIIALELSMDEALDLMKKAGFAFSKSSKFDVIINFFIENRDYDIFEINEVLFTYGQPILGE